MFQNYDFLLKCGLESDVVLVAREKELNAHKKVLSDRSPVFAAMFGHKSTKESQENRVEIIDVSVEILEQLVRYIYTDEIETLDKNARETECLDYIAYNGTRVIASKGWKNIVVRADLMAKICARMYLKYTELMIVDNDRKILDSNEIMEKGNSANFPLRAAKLFITAHKYKMDSLKSIFRQQLLSEEITTQSVSDFFIFADMHQITELATKCLDYITDNGTQVMASEEWKKIVVRADLLAKLFEHLSLKYKSVFDEQF